MSRCHFYLTVLLSVLCLGSSGLCERPRFDQLLPKATAVYLHIADFDSLIEQSGKTNIAEMLHDPAMSNLSAELWKVIAERLVEIEQRFDITLEELRQLPRGAVVIAMVARPRSAPGLALLMDVGDDPTVLNGLIENLEQQLLGGGADFENVKVGGTELSVFRIASSSDGNESSRQIVFCERAGLFLAATHVDVTRKILRAWDGEEVTTLRDNADYLDVTRAADRNSRGDVRMFVDPVRMVYAINGENVAAQASMAMLPVLGLDGVKGLAVNVTFAQPPFDWTLHAHLKLKAPRKGIPEMLALEGENLRVPDWVPDDVVNCLCFHWNVQRTMQAFEQLFDGFRGEGATQTMLQNRLEKSLEVNFREDILRQLTGEFVRITRNGPQALRPMSLLAAKLKNEDEFQQTLAAIVNKFANRLETFEVGETAIHVWQNRNQRDNEQVAATDSTTDDEANLSDEQRRRQQRENRRRRRRGSGEAAFGIVDGYFVASDDRRLLENVATTREEQRLWQSEDFQLIRQTVKRDLGIEFPAAVTYNNTKEIWRNRLALFQSEDVRAGMSRQFESSAWGLAVLQVLEKNPLPTFEALSEYLSSGGSAVTDEEDGLHYVWFSLDRESP